MKRCKQFSRGLRCLLLASVAVLSAAAPAYSQIEPAGRRYPGFRSAWGWRHYYGPADAISNRIRAQADLVRSIGDNAVLQADARNRRAEAYSKEIANSVEYAKAYWEKKEIYRAQKLRLYTAPLDAAEQRNAKTWRRLKDFPELNDNEINNGVALNFLLHRLSGPILATQYGLTNADPGLSAQLQLSPETLSKLRVREDLSGGKQRVFRVNSKESLNIEKWPLALQDDRFESQRNDFEKARAELAQTSPSDKKAVNDRMKVLMEAHDRLFTTFIEYYTQERRTESGGRNFFRFLASRRFLESLAGEMARLQELGSTVVLEDSAQFQGDNLLALVTHMSRHGLEFAPALNGDESAYRETFFIMRDLYRTVEDDDSVTQ
ncbi:hypothetical protein Mal52_33210 [Symmachiella dynata]|uniref:Ubiquitin-activating enzyme SCCH domain-containing protein n=1 Tax=Symmachiella dynata TaxID=2527995 RepID=A0A517ZQV7_9PLAN|nr:hypothetical protein [Symmachiella dynata]QDU44835.1 hypothetical protein Mal52_33210 [Symmachiella dynata]